MLRAGDLFGARPCQGRGVYSSKLAKTCNTALEFDSSFLHASGTGGSKYPSLEVLAKELIQDIALARNNIYTHVQM